MRGYRALFAFALILSSACSNLAPPSFWAVHTDDDLAVGDLEAANDVVKYLVKMGVRVERRSGVPSRCEPGEGQVIVHAERLAGAPNDQTLQIRETRCDGGIRVELSGGGLLGRQYAAYAWLRRLGVRFFHPEQEYVPQTPRWPDDLGRYERTHTPPYRWRSTSLHLTHPLELGDSIRLGNTEYDDEVRRHLDWTVKNFASRATATWPGDEGAAYAKGRGFRTSTGINLHSIQQGGKPIVDPDDPRPVNEQIAAAIDQRMGTDPTRYPETFSFSFNPSEFTEIDDQQAVSEMTFIANYMAEKYPATTISTINHGTHGKPTAHYSVRFYDLSKFAPPNLAVSVHPLMFYDLFRPAPVYGNTDFRFLYDFMAEQYTTRELTYFPEAAWWLTFDIAVPLYLPITLDARERDFSSLSYMLSGKLVGHHTFGTGHEWGYWQNEYCPFQMAFDADYHLESCLEDITLPLGDHAGRAKEILRATIAIEERDLLYGDVLRYVVGTDSETEVAASVGVDFHPLPPSPSEIANYDLARVAMWHSRIEPQLARMANELLAYAAELTAMEATVPADGAVWLRELRDGIEITGLRAEHARLVYGAMIGLRESQLRFDPKLATAANDALIAAKESTTRALTVVARREADYRYHPLDRAIGGGPDGNGDDNWTIYPYRYLNRTHTGFYWTRIDRLAEAALLAGQGAITVPDAMLPLGSPLVIELQPSLTGVQIYFGDAMQSQATGRVEHAYGAPGRYQLAVTATQAGVPISLGGAIAALEGSRERVTSPKVVAPAGAALIEGVLPDLTLGDLPAQQIAVGFTVAASGAVALGAWTPHDREMGLDRTTPATLVVPVVNRGSGATLTSVVVEDAIVDRSDPALLHITGQLAIASVIDAILAVGGGFDEPGARSIVAATLGYTPETLPAYLAFEVTYARP